ncbi:MAG: restriction endonuclease subunit S [Anaerolineae bacterium]
MLFCWSGQPETSIDVFYWRGPEGWLNQHIFKVDPVSEIDRRYFYYLLKYLNANFVRIARNKQTTGLGHVTKKDLQRLVVGLPERNEQRAIAHVLGTLDDKIELNRKMNATLEAMARAIFKSWFVDFDPVVYKAVQAGNPVPERFAAAADRYQNSAPPPVPDHIAALFPDRFEESELGEIPAGWRVGTLGDMVSVIKGKSYKSAELQDSDIALVTLKSIARGGGYQVEGLKPYVGRFKSEQLISPGEIVVAHTDVTQAAEVLGRVARVPSHPEFKALIASLDLAIVRPNEKWFSNEFLFGVLADERFVHHAQGYANGTTVLHLNKNAVAEYRLLLPSRAVVEAFTTLTRPMYELAVNHESAGRVLSEIRDALLPKLISGEIRVGER